MQLNVYMTFSPLCFLCISLLLHLCNVSVQIIFSILYLYLNAPEGSVAIYIR